MYPYKSSDPIPNQRFTLANVLYLKFALIDNICRISLKWFQEFSTSSWLLDLSQSFVCLEDSIYKISAITTKRWIVESSNWTLWSDLLSNDQAKFEFWD